MRWTGRAEGDLGIGGRHTGSVDPVVADRRAAVLDRPWSWLHQVHGSRVVVVDRAGGGAGEDADALVTTAPDAALAIFTADCAPVALASGEGVIGAVHAGWRGIVGGVLEGAVEAMRRLGATGIEGALGPCIHAECYEFGADDLDAVAARLGDGVRSSTAAGRPSLDVPAAVAAALDRVGVPLVHTDPGCTACHGDRWYSHRARGDVERQAMVVWLP